MKFPAPPQQPPPDSEEVNVTVGLPTQFEFPSEDDGDPYESCSTWARIFCGRSSVTRSAAPVLTAREMEARRIGDADVAFNQRWGGHIQLDEATPTIPKPQAPSEASLRREEAMRQALDKLKSQGIDLA